MIQFNGHHLDGRSSSPTFVQVELAFDTLSLRRHDGQVHTLSPQDCTIDPPLGQLERSIRLPDGGQLLTNDVAAVAQWEQQRRDNRGQRLVHRLEQRWLLALFSVAFLVLLTVAGVRYGIPFAASVAAPRIPAGALTALSETTLDMLDQHWFAQTTLPPRDQMRVEALFNQTRHQFDASLDARLRLRKGGDGVGANAFALPDGTIVVTDQLVALAHNDQELVGVMAHEMAHIQKHHAMRGLLQNAGVFLLVSTLAGDVTSISGLAATLPTLLLERGYSRDFEREADDRAAAYLRSRGWGVSPYTDMLRRLDEDRPGSNDPGYLSTHPQTDQRIERLLQQGAKTISH